MSGRIASMTVPELAKAFNEATVRKWGTDEDAVFAIADEVRRRGRTAKSEFQRAVAEDLTASQRARLIHKGNGNIVHGIFCDEFSETFSKADLARAYRLFDGWSPVQAGGFDDFLGGFGENFDLSGTKAKIGAAAFLGLALLCPPAAAVAAGVILLNGADDLEWGLRTGNYREAGRGAGAMLGAIPGLRGAKGFKAPA
ncbi:MAG TPA: hypothetical protein VFX30_13095, partial [bacterium]|nr:hypothetical protein [bacterium]